MSISASYSLAYGHGPRMPDGMVYQNDVLYNQVDTDVLLSLQIDILEHMHNRGLLYR